MTTATYRQQKENLETYKKTYVYHLDSYKSQNGEYLHPYIDFIKLGSSYPEGRFGTFRSFSIEFQQNLTTPETTNAGLPYGGRVENLSLTDLDDLHKLMTAVHKQIERLQIYSQDNYQNMVTALRAAGYRRGIKNNDGAGYIVAIE